MIELKNRRWQRTSEQLMLPYVWTVDFHLTRLAQDRLHGAQGRVKILQPGCSC